MGTILVSQSVFRMSIEPLIKKNVGVPRKLPHSLSGESIILRWENIRKKFDGFGIAKMFVIDEYPSRILVKSGRQFTTLSFLHSQGMVWWVNPLFQE